MGEPRFVVRIEPEMRRVVIGEKHELACTALAAKDVNWLVAEPAGSIRCTAQVRYNSEATPAIVTTLPGGRMQIEFDQPRFGVAPGQAVVCYDGDRVLGGGWIE
jgi:tRNA-specific 2-thiouridylase